MRCLVAFLLVSPPSFAAGWYARDWWAKHHQARLRDDDVKKVSDHWLNIMFAILVLGVLGNIVYTNVSDRRTAEQISASEMRQNDENRRNIACMSRTFEEFLTGNQVLREASAKRDAALVKSKEALRDLVFLRVVKGVPDSPEVQAAASEYLAQTQLFVDASKELTKARRDYRLPDFEKACGNVVK